ncbi:unnamed protein product, partial [Heterotrigona itama]
ILAYSPEKLQFTAEIRWTERDNGNLWLLTTRFQKFFKQEVNMRDINIRIMRLTPMQYRLKHPALNSFNQPYIPSQCTLESSRENVANRRITSRRKQSYTRGQKIFYVISICPLKK